MLCWFLLLWCGIMVNGAPVGQQKLLPGRYRQADTLRALDCRKPVSIKHGMIADICQNATMNSTGKMEEVYVMQRASQVTVKGHRCTRRVTSVYEVCGAFSHSKLMQPPSILEPEMLSMEDCLKMRDHSIYTKEDGNTISTDVNTVVRYKMVRHGTLHTSTENVECVGTTIWINQEQHKSVVELLSVELLIEEIDISIEGRKATDLDREIPLPEACVSENRCLVGTTSYVLRPRPDQCPLFVVRKLPMEHIQVDTDAGRKPAIINRAHKLFFMLGEQEAVPDCPTSTNMYHTEYPNILLAFGANPGRPQKTIGGSVTASLVDPELELKIVAEFLAYEQETRVNDEVEAISRELCHRMRTTLLEQELSPFHQDALLRVRGDVVQEIFCTAVDVELRMGEKRGASCYAKAIPAYLRDEPVWVTAGERLVVSQHEAGEVPCGQQPPPVFRTAYGNLVVADPDVKAIQLPLEHLGEAFVHAEGKLRHEVSDGELLYTEEEMAQYNQLVHYGRTREIVLDNLVAKYCSSGECGNYQPARPDNFNLDHLGEELTPWGRFWHNTKEDIAYFGSGCASLIVLYFMIRTLFAILGLFIQICIKGTPLSIALWDALGWSSDPKQPPSWFWAFVANFPRREPRPVPRPVEVVWESPIVRRTCWSRREQLPFLDSTRMEDDELRRLKEAMLNGEATAPTRPVAATRRFVDEVPVAAVRQHVGALSTNGVTDGPVTQEMMVDLLGNGRVRYVPRYPQEDLDATRQDMAAPSV